MTVAVRSGYVLLPSDKTTSGKKFSKGILLGVDWLNKNSNCHKIEFSYDQFHFQDSYDTPSGFTRYSSKYTINIIRISYGLRRYALLTDEGIYGEINFGAMLGLSDRLSSAQYNILSRGVIISPGFGFAGKPFTVGIQLQLALDRSEILLYPAIHAGFHLMPDKSIYQNSSLNF